jgi:uncharacterized protein YndB with AHSA1/START domain
MDSTQKKRITVEAFVKASINVVWKLWNAPEDIIWWHNASDDWYMPNAKTDLRPGGKFLIRMEAKDGNAGFDFSGVFNKVKVREFISYTLGDGRKVEINFKSIGTDTNIVETFEAENQNPIEMQRNGWQSILNNFKNYAEAGL